MNTLENTVHSRNRERPMRAANGWLLLLITLVLILHRLGIRFRHFGVYDALRNHGVGCLPRGCLDNPGDHDQQRLLHPPAQRGSGADPVWAYQGTVRDSGFFWTNPFNKRVKISLAPATSTATNSR